MDAYMIDKTPNEKAALNDAVAAAGNYIEAIGVYDFLKFTPDQFDTLIETVVTAYVESLQRQVLGDELLKFP
jgi:hypothetical protein